MLFNYMQKLVIRLHRAFLATIHKTHRVIQSGQFRGRCRAESHHTGLQADSEASESGTTTGYSGDGSRPAKRFGPDVNKYYPKIVN